MSSKLLTSLIFFFEDKVEKLRAKCMSLVSALKESFAIFSEPVLIRKSQFLELDYLLLYPSDTSGNQRKSLQ